MSVWVGIDPGLGGAVAVFTNSERIIFADTPTLKIKVGKSIKRQINIPAAVAILEKIKRHADNESTSIHVTIEKVNAMPAHGIRIGSTALFNFGLGFGVWLGILGALRIPHTLVTPRAWKKAMMPDATKDKQASILRAQQLFPQTASDLTRKKDDGRADALLIASYGKQLIQGSQERPVQLKGRSRIATNKTK